MFPKFFTCPYVSFFLLVVVFCFSLVASNWCFSFLLLFFFFSLSLLSSSCFILFFHCCFSFLFFLLCDLFLFDFFCKSSLLLSFFLCFGCFGCHHWPSVYICRVFHLSLLFVVTNTIVADLCPALLAVSPSDVLYVFFFVSGSGAISVCRRPSLRPLQPLSGWCFSGLSLVSVGIAVLAIDPARSGRCPIRSSRFFGNLFSCCPAAPISDHFGRLPLHHPLHHRCFSRAFHCSASIQPTPSSASVSPVFFRRHHCSCRWLSSPRCYPAVLDAV